MRRAAVAICLTLLSSACSEPPQKEIDRAQGAIDAARAAGAAQYAAEPYNAALAAMQQTHDAVEQRDYRLALSRAIDANDQALEAARQAASGKAAARSSAEGAIAHLATTIRQMDEKLKAAQAARLTARDLASASAARHDAERVLQEARAAAAKEDYLAAAAATKGVPERIAAEIRALSETIDARTARTPRRRR
jgi:hypothetical protein